MVDFLLVIVVDFFSVYMTLQYYRVVRKEGGKATVLWCLPYTIFFVLLNVCCYFLVKDFNETAKLFCAVAAAGILLCETVLAFQKENEWKERMERQDYLVRRQLQYYARQYETLSHLQESMRKERHERKNRNLELLMLVQKGDFQGAEERLMDEQAMLRRAAGFLSTGNRTVDAVLGLELVLAEEKDIEVQQQIAVPGNMDVADSVLCGVIGNALDNAIEACCYLPESKRWISVFMSVERKNLLIEVSNSFDGKIVSSSDGRLLSRKEDKRNHGMGLRIIKELLEQADGSLETLWDEKAFTLRIMLYHIL